jgi:hypothetical protein
MTLAARVSLALLAIAACAPPEHERLGGIAQPIIAGTASPAEQDHVVQLARRENGAMVPLCTGTLIAKNLVITARHCTGDITAVGSVELIADYPAAEIKVYVGRDAGPQTVDREPAAEGKQLLHGGDNVLTPDVALLVLDRALEAPIAPIRLASGAAPGEALDIVGYGLTEADRYPRARQRRPAQVAAVGPATTTHFDVLAGEFQTGEAACVGDSGGPALSASTGAVIGIASRVTNGQGPSETEPSRFCIGATTEAVYSDLPSARSMIDRAFAAAGATPWLEGQPPPGPGPVPPNDDEGCTAAGRAPAPADAWLLAGTLLLLFRRRPRRS